MEDKFRVLRNAEKYVVNGQFDRAVTEYRRIIEVHGEDPSVLNTLGDLHLKTNQRDKALGCFLRVAEIFSQSGYISKAIAIYRKVEQLNPSARDAVGKLAELYTRRGLRSEALKYWRRFGTLLEQTGERDSLISARRQIAEMDAENPAAHADLASVLGSVSADEAAQEFLAAARLYLEAEAFSEAEGAARQAVALDGSCFAAREIIAEVEERLPPESQESSESSESLESSELPESSESVDSSDSPGVSEPPQVLPEVLDEDTVPAPPQEPVVPVSEPPELVEEASVVAVEAVPDAPELPPEPPPVAESEPEDLQAEADKWSAELAEAAFFDLDEPPSPESTEKGEAAGPPNEPESDEDSFFADVSEPAPRAPDSDGPTESRDPASPAGSDVSAVQSEQGQAPSNLLEEVDFYLKLDLNEDAERILGGLLASHPDDPRVRTRAEQLGLVEPVTHSDGETIPEQVDSSVPKPPSDEAEELSPYAADVESALDDLFFEEVDDPADSEVKESASETAADSDEPRTDFDLGVAYREMGMFEDAVSKFTRGYERSMELDEPEQAVKCAAMLASTCLLVDNAEESLKWADIALGLPRSESQDYMALEYDRAAALEVSGRTEESLEVYRKIVAEDPEFRDVQERVSRLDQMPG